MTNRDPPYPTQGPPSNPPPARIVGCLDPHGGGHSTYSTRDLFLDVSKVALPARSNKVFGATPTRDGSTDCVIRPAVRFIVYNRSHPPPHSFLLCPCDRPRRFFSLLVLTVRTGEAAATGRHRGQAAEGEERGGALQGPQICLNVYEGNLLFSSFYCSLLSP